MCIQQVNVQHVYVYLSTVKLNTFIQKLYLHAQTILHTDKLYLRTHKVLHTHKVIEGSTGLVGDSVELQSNVYMYTYVCIVNISYHILSDNYIYVTLAIYVVYGVENS